MTDRTHSKKQQGKTSGTMPMALPDPSKPLAGQEPGVLLAMCLFGEARGESDAARRAIAQVALNRAKTPRQVFGSRPGADFAENLRCVILKPRQFSCFLADDPNYPKLLRPLDYEAAEVWERCLRSAQEALAGKDEEDFLTANSDHYFDDSLQPPPWADPAKQTVRIGRLRFYRLYLPPPRRGGAASPALQSLGVGGTAAGLPPSPPSSPRTSFPAPHPPSQRSPRLGLNRWFQRSRELSHLGSGLGNRELGFANVERRQLQ